jgi:hypothetical protein
MNNPTWRRTAVLSAVLCILLVVIGCGRSVEGTYSSASGTMILELRSGGKAAFTMMGETQACTYKVNGKTIHLICGKDELNFHIMDDGSLNTNSELVGVLKKSK